MAVVQRVQVAAVEVQAVHVGNRLSSRAPEVAARALIAQGTTIPVVDAGTAGLLKETCRAADF